jgi:hypothetical protein
VLGLLGTSDALYAGAALPLALPGTACSLLTSADQAVVAFADASGAVSGAAVALAVPATAALNGLPLYEQFAALAPGANALGLAFSDAVAVTLGTYTAPGNDYYMVGHDSDASAPFANQTRAFGYAVRIGTL